MAIKVTLRQKSISKKRKSLYLDYYPAVPNLKTGKPTRREFLSLYIFEKTNNPIDKQHNKETLQLAEQIRQKRHSEINKPEIYSGFEKEQLKIKEMGQENFVLYFKKLANKRKPSNQGNWISALKYLETFTNGQLKFSEISISVLENFRNYLLTTKSNKSEKSNLAQNSAVSYFNKVKASLKQAFKDGYLQTDINAKIESIKPLETQREHLTIDELNTLIKTPCNDPLLKRAALFSALTGLRHSDIIKLVWGEIEFIENQGYSLRFRQQKTNAIENLPISKQAYNLLQEPGAAIDKVFEGLIYSAYANKHLSQWIGLAGITKNITFHNFRHTYAVLQLSNGTDLYTISKMLGHKNINTTQIYAKIVDKTKRDATKKINLDL